MSTPTPHEIARALMLRKDEYLESMMLREIGESGRSTGSHADYWAAEAEVTAQDLGAHRALMADLG